MKKKKGYQIRDIVELVEPWVGDSIEKGSIGEVVRYNGYDVEVIFKGTEHARLMSERQLSLILRPITKKDIVKIWLINKIRWL